MQWDLSKMVIKMKNIFDLVCDYELLKKDHIQWN